MIPKCCYRLTEEYAQSRRVGTDDECRRVLRVGRYNVTLEDVDNRVRRVDACMQVRAVGTVASVLAVFLAWWLSQNSTAVDVCVSAVFLTRCGVHSSESVSLGIPRYVG